MIIGITGAFGCGKSAVLRFFASKNWHTFDADSVCKSFYDSQEPYLCSGLKKIFGDTVFTAENKIDRSALAEIIFCDAKKKKQLTDMIYPLLTGKMMQEIFACRCDSINGAFEIPLLYEAGFANCFDAVLSVWAPMKLRRKRLYGRGFSDAEIDRRTKLQIDADEKLERADFAVINTGSVDELYRQLAELIKRI